MTREDLVRRLEAAEKQNIGLIDEIKNLKAQLAEMQDEPEIPDMPYFDEDEKYWFVDDEIGVTDGAMCFGDSTEDFNVFHTPEYAQEFAKKCKLIAMMLHCKWHLCRGFKEDFSKRNLKWYLYTDNTSHFATDCCALDARGSVYFDTEENAKKSADWLNKHWKDNENE